MLYIAVVLRLTVFRFGVSFEQRQINLIPFVDLAEVFTGAVLWAFLRLFLGNIGWFVPFGFLLPVLMKNPSFLKIVLSGFVFSFGIEVAQYFSRQGVAELDDLLLNTLGVMIGYFGFKIFVGKNGLQPRITGVQ